MRKPKLTKLKNTLSVLLLILIVIGVGIYISRNLNEFKNLSRVPILAIWSVALSFIGMFIISSLLLKIILNMFSVNMSFLEALGLTSITNISDLVAPFVGGMGVKAAYLKKYHKLSLISFMGLVAIRTTMSLAMVSILGIIGLLILYIQTNLFSWVFSLVFLAILIFSTSILFVPFRLLKWGQQYRLIQKINLILQGRRDLQKNKKAFGKILIFTFLALAFEILATYFSFIAFYPSFTIIDSMVVSMMAIISGLARLTPGNIGISEMVVVFISTALGYKMAESLSSALLKRVVLTGLIIVGAGIAFPIMSRNKGILKRNSVKERKKFCEDLD